MTHTTDDNIRSILKKKLLNHHEIDSLEFGEIKEWATLTNTAACSLIRYSILDPLTFHFSPEQAVKDDMKFLAESPYLASKDTPIKLHGFIYDIKTGELEKVQE